MEEAIARYLQEASRTGAAGGAVKAKEGQVSKRLDCQQQVAPVGPTPVASRLIHEGAVSGVSARAAGESRAAGVGVPVEPSGEESVLKKTQLAPKVDLKKLMEAKVLDAGDAITCKRKQGRIAADGFIDYNGKRMKVRHSKYGWSYECAVVVLMVETSWARRGEGQRCLASLCQGSTPRSHRRQA